MKGSLVRWAFCLWMALLLLPLAGCLKENTRAKGGQELVSANKAPVVATVWGEEITEEDLQAALQRAPRRYQHDRVRALDNLIQRKVFSEEARRMGLENDPDVQAALDKSRVEILARYFVEKHVDPAAEPTEGELKDYYETHKEDFVIPESVSIQHFCGIKEQDARWVLALVEKGDKTFEDLIKERSNCNDWNKEGRYGWVFRGKIEPELEKVLFALEIGKLSDVVKTDKGYEIVKVLEKRDTRVVTFDEARKRIHSKLYWEKKFEVINQYYEREKVDRHPAEPGVLVKIGDEAIAEERLAPILAKVSEDRREKTKEKWIKYFVETGVFSKEATKVNLQDDPEVAGALKRETDKILAKAFYERFIKDKLEVTDKDLEAFYQSHLDQFRKPERVRTQAILVDTKEEAEKILEELKKGGSFNTFAVNKSLHPDAARTAGYMPWFGKGEKDPAVEKAAFALEPGEISDVIETEAGYEIIRLVEKKGGQVPPLSDGEVKARAKMELTRERFQKEKQGYYEKAGVKIFEGA
jgi:peptidyl-prolyl cis-trans isomerase C